MISEKEAYQDYLNCQQQHKEFRDKVLSSNFDLLVSIANQNNQTWFIRDWDEFGVNCDFRRFDWTRSMEDLVNRLIELDFEVNYAYGKSGDIPTGLIVAWGPDKESKVSELSMEYT